MSLEIKLSEFKEMLSDFGKGWTPGKGYNCFLQPVLSDKDWKILDKYFIYEEEERECMDGEKRNFPVSLYHRKPKLSDDVVIDLDEFEWFVFTPTSGHGSEMNITQAYKIWKKYKLSSS